MLFKAEVVSESYFGFIPPLISVGKISIAFIFAGNQTTISPGPLFAHV
jgi:hypothetical protein